jgi:hypothetical protein
MMLLATPFISWTNQAAPAALRTLPDWHSFVHYPPWRSWLPELGGWQFRPATVTVPLCDAADMAIRMLFRLFSKQARSGGGLRSMQVA